MRPLLLALMLCWNLPAHGVALRLCQDARSHAPLMQPDGGGVVDRMVRQAAAESGLEMQTYASPNCRDDMKRGRAQAFPLAPYLPEALPFVVYPMRQGRADMGRAVMLVRSMVFRRSGSDVAWDGQHLLHLSGGLLTNAGSVRHSVEARRLGIPVDPLARSAEQNFTRLLGAPNAAAVMLEVDGQSLLEHADFAGKIDMLPTPFVEEMYFVVFSKDYYAANRKYVERFWTAIGRLRLSPAYAAPLREAAPARD